MSVYTTVTTEFLNDFLQYYDLGDLIGFRGIASGITNTNYFVDTTHGRVVLTLFETLSFDEIPFFMQLKAYLNRHGVACPAPLQQHDGAWCAMLCGKPAVLISCLNGSDEMHPNEKHCFAVGSALAKMHLASQNFPLKMPNPRYTQWWTQSAQILKSVLPQDELWLLNHEIEYQASLYDEGLPSGIIHADLFRDNVLLYENEVSGIIDFYYACDGTFVYDIAIAVNDWARNSNHQINPILQSAWLAGYESVRPLREEEYEFLPNAYRAAALRFWVSRLLDYYFPPEGELTFTKNPNDFRDLLLTLCH